MKNIIYSIIFLIMMISITYAGCGSCNISNKKTKIPEGSFITSIGEEGNINGLLLASCGMCNFGMKEKKMCNLAIQINDKAYDVTGTGIDDHGDAHAKGGFCNAVRVAKVSGKIEKDIFISKSFILQKD